jgi:phage terminase large subunit GpA-like protein
MKQTSAKTPTRIVVSGKWKPEGAPRVHRFCPASAERKALRRRRAVPVSKWAERHRVLTMSSMPGKWRNDVTPYLAGIMDASFSPCVQEVDVCAAPQVGKRELVNHGIGYAIDRQPGPAMFVYPDQITAKENCMDRVLPMISASTRLSTYRTGVADDEASLRINLQHMPLYFSWARSASRLSNKPVRYMVCDEVDKYPDTAGKREADPISLAKKRTTTYKWNRKIWTLSTPTTESGPIWRALNAAQVVFHFHVRCPKCGAWQLMIFDQIRFDKDCRDPERMVAEQLAAYECDLCGGHWDDAMRDRAVRLGEWRDSVTGAELQAYLRAHRPRHVGFHLPSWLSPFVSLSECAAAFLRGLKDKVAMRDFMNAHKAEPWVEYTQERSEDRILQLRDDRPRYLVPGGGQVACLTAGIDTQSGRGGYFVYEIRAWGWGMAHESWQICEGEVGSFEALAEVLWGRQYLDAAGQRYLVRLALIDAMGHYTAEVYDFCRTNRGRILPLKGERTMNRPHAFTQVDTYPGTNKPIAGGLKLLRVNTTHFKNALSSKLEVHPADPGAWHLHSEATEDWARQLCAEYVDDKGHWVCPDHKANHGWDVSAYNLAAADLLGVKAWTPRAAKPKAARPAPHKTATPNPYTGGLNLLGRRER